MFEINLVPDIKRETLHKKRILNLVIFGCLVVISVCAGILVILGGTLTAQTVAVTSIDKNLKVAGDKVLNFDNADQLLTIQDQLKNIESIDSGKNISSRIFGILDVILPVGRDTVQIKDASLDLETGTMSFTAKADSTPEEGFSSGIDWRALDAFRNIVLLSRWDYGRYINKEGEPILARCIEEETREEGGTMIVYGVYKRGLQGCQEGDSSASSDVAIKRDMTETELNNAIDSGGYYFDSECMDFVAGAAKSSCVLSESGVESVSASNSRDSSGEVVLGFSAKITLPTEIFSFEVKHVRVIGPTRQNVTDSYTQLRELFDHVTTCAANDTECLEANS